MAGVVETLRLQYPEQPIQTIHDSILTPVEGAEIARLAIEKEFRSLGLEPSIKTKARKQQEP